MALNTKIRGVQINDAVAGDGLSKDGNDNFKVNVDASSIEIVGDILQVKALGISNAMLAGSISISKLDTSGADFDANGFLLADVIDPDHINVTGEGDGKVLTYKTGGFWEYTEVIQNTDVITAEIPTGLINGSNTSYTLANTPVVGTVRVYLNGLRQEEGSGKDYTLSGTTVTFATAPVTGDILFVDYFIN